MIAKLEITMSDEGIVDVVGTGAILKHKAVAYGLLELAKDVIRGDHQSAIAPANRFDVSQFTKQ